MTRQYLFQILFFAPKEGLQNGLLISMTYLFSPICIFFKYKFFRVLSLSINIYTPKYYVTKKRACNVLFSEFPAYPGNFIVILNNFRLPRQEETINKNKQNKTQQKIDIYVFAFVSLRPKLKEKCRDLFFTKYSVFTSCS